MQRLIRGSSICSRYDRNTSSGIHQRGQKRERQLVRSEGQGALSSADAKISLLDAQLNSHSGVNMEWTPSVRLRSRVDQCQRLYPSHSLLDPLRVTYQSWGTVNGGGPEQGEPLGLKEAESLKVCAEQIR